MEPTDPVQSYEEVKRCLLEADRAFARAAEIEDDEERVRLIEEAERWLVRAERRLAVITGRDAPGLTPIAGERRSFGAAREPPSVLGFRRTPRI